MLLLAVLVLAGCGREKKIESELLGIEEKDGYTLVTVRDPWKAGQTLHRYALVPRDKPLPDGLPDATVIKVPLRSAGTTVMCMPVRLWSWAAEMPSSEYSMRSISRHPKWLPV